MRKNKKESIILGKLFKKLAPRIGAKVLIEPKWGVVGQITFKNGNRSYFRYNSVDLNHVGSADLAKDKDYSNFFMKKMGYKIIPKSKVFFEEERAKAIGAENEDIKSAYKYAESIGFPVVVKPNSGSQGVGVSKVRNKKEFFRAMREIFRNDHTAIVQSPVYGNDYRIVVLDDEVISAYQRIPLSVLGDGKSGVLKLLKIKQKEFQKQKRDTIIKINDPRIIEKLQSQKLNLNSIPLSGQRVFLLDNANLSTGGDSVDVTSLVHEDFKKIAVKLTKDMGLRLCGVDLMVLGEIKDKPSKYWILEVNAAPGLDHYSKVGNEQEKIVEDLYFKVLKQMES